MAQFGGKKYGLDSQAKGAGWYGLTEEDFRQAWDDYHRGFKANLIVSELRRRTGSRRISLKKLVVEWGAMGLPVWSFGRRGKIRRGASRILNELQERFDMPLTPTIYAALKFAYTQGADLRAIVEEEFGAAPKRPKSWYEKDPWAREQLEKLRNEQAAMRLGDPA